MSTGIELMQHALGINERQRQPYRNYFLAGGDHPDTTEWQKLVEQGLAKSSPAPSWSCGEVVYQVTGAGEALAISALPEPKKPTRYEEYRHSEVCESFGEWLGIQLSETAARWPEHIEKHRQWELKVRLTSRWVHWMSVGTESQTWMRQFDLPLGRSVQLHGLEPDIQRIEWSGFYGPRGTMGAPSAPEVVEWAKTGRGGKVYDLVKASLDTEVCSSRYGLCE